MISTYLILLREGVEATLIVAIILSYLSRKSAGKGSGYVWTGVGLGVVASLITAAIFHYTVGGFSGRAEEIFEGILMLVACGVLLYMVVWTARAACDMKAALTDQVDVALVKGQLWSLALLVFFAVLREGAETVLFLAALPSAKGSTALAGAGLGLISAAVIGFVYYKAAGLINLRRFFSVTAVLLIMMASGLAAHGVHELQEAKVLPTVKEHVFDINPTIQYTPGPAVDFSAAQLAEIRPALGVKTNCSKGFCSKRYKPFMADVENGILAVKNPFALAIHERGVVGSVAKAVFGYNGNPSLIELITYFVVLVGSTGLFVTFSSKRKSSKSGSVQV